MKRAGQARSNHPSQRVAPLAYMSAAGLLSLALAFPFALMVFEPALMFERGWEQYVGTGIYLWATLTLVSELWRLWTNERAFDQAPALLEKPETIRPDDRRLLPARLRILSAHAAERVPALQLMELNRESSALDQEHDHGRFTINRYILYLLPVIGFIGTVEGISKALVNIGKVLPMVKDLDGFLSNLSSVTAALQIAFDSTLLALFLSAALMLVQTLVIRRSDDLLARVDGWVVENVLPRLGTLGAAPDPLASLAEPLARWQESLHDHTLRSTTALENLAHRLDAGLGAPIAQFASAIDQLNTALGGLERGAASLARIDQPLSTLGEAADAWKRAAAALVRIEQAIAHLGAPDDQLDAIRRGVDRSGLAIEALSGQFSAAFEKSNRATQEQLAQTLGRLKDALELLQVSIEQGNSLYRSIVKRMLAYPNLPDERAA